MTSRTSLLPLLCFVAAACAAPSPDAPPPRGYQADVSPDGALHLSTPEVSLVVATREVRVGDRVLGAAARGVDATTDRVDVDRGELHEEHWLRADGVEQRWTFASRPTGDGPLEIRVRVEGATYEGADDRGLRFVGPRGRVRYGLASWIDADGARDIVGARVDAGDIVLTVPRERLDASTYPAVLDPLIGPEVDVDALGTTTARLDQTGPVVAYASGADHYVAGWRDERERLQGGVGASIWATRVSWRGAVLDRGGVRVTSLRDDPRGLSVACAPSTCLFTWEEAGMLRTARVGADGAVNDFDGAPVVPTAGAESEPAVSWDGTSFVLVSRLRDGAGVLARRVDPATGASSAPVVIGTWGVPSMPSVACATGACVASYVDELTGWLAYASLSTASRISLSRTTWHSPVGLVRPAIAFDRTTGSYVTSFVAATGELRVARLAPGGASTTGEVTAASSGVFHAEQLALSCSAWGGCALAWNASPNTRIVRLRADGSAGLTLLDATPLELGGAPDYLHDVGVAADCCNGFYATTTWNSASLNGDSDAWGAPFTLMMLPVPSLLSTSAPDARNHELASGASSSLLVWEEYRSGRTDVRAAIQSSSGALGAPFVVRASEVVTVPFGTVHTSPKLPAAAYDGAGWTVVWQERRTSMDTHDVYAARVSPSGAVGPATLVAGDAAADEEVPDVACSAAGDCVVTWFQAGGTLSIGASYRRLRAGGAPSPEGAAPVPFATPGYPLPPHVASVGSTFVFATKLLTPSPTAPFDAGVVEVLAVKPDGLSGFSSPTTVESELDRTDVECGSSGCWATWRAGLRGKGTIVAMPTNLDGAARLSNPLELGTDIDASSPRLACDSVGCLVAWTRTSTALRLSDVISREVDWASGLLGAPTAVAVPARFESTPVPARAQSAAFTVAYRTFHDEPAVGAARGHLRAYAR